MLWTKSWYQWSEMAWSTHDYQGYQLQLWVIGLIRYANGLLLHTMIFSHTNPRNIMHSQQDCINSCCLSIKGCSRSLKLGWQSEHNGLWWFSSTANFNITSEKSTHQWARKVRDECKAIHFIIFEQSLEDNFILKEFPDCISCGHCE